jgi:hypothetical protein
MKVSVYWEKFSNVENMRISPRALSVKAPLSLGFLLATAGCGTLKVDSALN